MNETLMTRKRPTWVWIICVFYLVSFLWTSLSWYMIFSGSIVLSPEVKAYMESLTSFDYGLTTIQALISISAAVALFFLRKQAYYLFWSSFGVGLFAIAWQTALRSWLTAMRSIKGGTTGELIGMGILLAVCIYTRKLRKQGRLS